jgi:phosphate transport system permease protein
MTDVAAARPALALGGASAKARIAKRYAAERRFRFYGIAAIVVTALFVAALLADIVSKGYPAFTEHRLVLDVTASQDALDPQKTGDIKKIRAGDFDGIIRDALRAELPSVEKRADRKLLFGLLSSGAADDFRNMVVADPSLVGKDVRIPALLSDDADQYLKGYQTAVEHRPGGADLTIAAEGDLVRLTSSPAEFAGMLTDVRSFIAREVGRDGIELARLDAAVSDLERSLLAANQRLDTANQSADQAATAEVTAFRDKLASDLEGLKISRDTYRATLEALKSKGDVNAATLALDDKTPSLLVEAAGGIFKVTEISAGALIAEPIIPAAQASASARSWRVITLETPESSRRITDKEAAWLETLKSRGVVESGFAWRFLTSGDSREAELAGIKGALVGSALTLIVTLAICLPLGVGAAIYLEEFAPKNRLTDIIEININNLAAVPSIVFGLLGLAMFLNFFGLPRSAPLVGGLVLALLVLPTIIIASRAALKAVPPSVKEAALGVGASHQQAIFHHVLPLAIPGIMTGTIIGMAHALGETAPLLMIGMVAFIVDVPGGITDAATAMPVQIYLWSDLPEIAFQAKTAAAIIVLLVFLFVMNALAIITRKRFERRW